MLGWVWEVCYMYELCVHVPGCMNGYILCVQICEVLGIIDWHVNQVCTQVHVCV